MASLLAAAGVTALAGTAEAASTLGAAAAEEGRCFGAAVAANHMGEAPYVSTLNTEFNSVTPENEMKWDATERTRGTFTFGDADRIVNHAQSRGMKARGHTPSSTRPSRTATAVRDAARPSRTAAAFHWRARSTSTATTTRSPRTTRC